jgi:hypothetical protein
VDPPGLKTPATLERNAQKSEIFSAPTGVIVKSIRISLSTSLLLAIPALFPAGTIAQNTSAVKPAPSAASAPTPVPALLPYSAIALGNDGKPLGKAELTVTFQLFTQQSGGDPVWVESQIVATDESGHFEVQLGASSASGVPLTAFTAGDSRWLEVQIAGQKPGARVLLTSVPYAIKAADAATLGGLPASAFMLAGAQTNETRAVVTPDASSNAVTTPGGTAGYLPVYSATAIVDNSILFESGTRIGLNTAAPAATLDVNGTLAARGTLTLESTGTATSAAGANSQPLDFAASAYNATAKTVALPLFSLQAEAAGNNTATPGGTLNLLYGLGATPAETGLSISSKGVIKFAAGQTFPGAGTGTITGVTTAAPLTGSGTTGSVALGLNLTALETTLNARYPQLAVASKFTAPVTFSVPVTFASTQTFPGIPGGGTITGVTTASPLTGSGAKGSVALGLNLAALQTTLNASYAQLNAANKFTQPITFAAGQTFPGAGTITGITAGTGLLGGGAAGAIKLSLDPKAIPTLTGSPVFTSSTDGLQGVTAGTVLNTAGVQGEAGSPSGAATGIAGVWGDAYAHVGVLGTSYQYSGVQGVSTNSYGVQGSSTSNTGVLGVSTSGTGVSGLSTSSSGVAGYTPGSTINTAGVNGKAGALSGITQIVAGVWGDSYQQVGVEGTSNQSVGVYGQSTGYNGVVGISNVAIGVAGNSNSGTGMAGSSNTGAGVVGYTAGSTLNTGGVIGIAGPRTNFAGISGIWGDAANHVGVQGTSNIYTGVQGSSVSGPGVQGNSTSGNGLHGVSQSTSGIFGETSSASGGDAALYGLSHNGALGVFGFSPKFGIEGESGGNSGVGALSSVFVNGPAAIWGDTSSAGYAVAGTTDNGVAGQFINNSASQQAMYVGNFYNGYSDVAEFTGEAGGCEFFGNGDVLCDGKISSAVKLKDSATSVKTYSVQSTENWYEDAGSAKLINGAVHVEFEATFSQTVNTEVAYQVFLTPGGDSDGLYVTNKTAAGFDVREQHGGHSNIPFDYRILAKRAGHETERLEDVTAHEQTQTSRRTQMVQAIKAAPAKAENLR